MENEISGTFCTKIDDEANFLNDTNHQIKSQKTAGHDYCKILQFTYR